MWNSCRNCSESGNPELQSSHGRNGKPTDVIQAMTVHPGRDGQHFIEDTLDKIKDIRRRTQIPESGKI